MTARHVRFLTILAAVAHLPCHAADPEWERQRALALDLIATMKLDEQAVQKVEKVILADCQVKKCDADLRKCLMKIDRAYITDLLQSDVIDALTPDEMKEAIIYFRSETGLKHLDVMRAEQGLGGDETIFNQTPAVRARMLAFLDTRVGYLVVTRGVLTERANRRTQAMARMTDYKCRPLN